MASDVDLANGALSALGDVAVVTSTSGGDTSFQGVLVNRFYPIALQAMQEDHTWGFCTKRATLVVEGSVTPVGWQYAYAAPADAVLNYLTILDSAAADQWSGPVLLANIVPGQLQSLIGIYEPQPFVVEELSGADVIYTNQANATLLYTTYITDTTQFSPLFNQAFIYLLASHLAGPIIKGQEGRAVASAMLKMHDYWIGKAKNSDANQRRSQIAHSVPWIVSR